MDTKRIRFGFACTNPSFLTADMLSPLRVRSMECALPSEGKQFVVFTVEKPTRAFDVLKVVDDFNAEATAPLILEKFEGNDEMIVLFDKGQRYLQHPFYIAMQGVKNQGAEGDSPPRIWEWSADGVPGPRRRKRVAGELVSDLVEDAILPSAPKRQQGASTADEEEKSAKQKKSKKVTTTTTQPKQKSKENSSPSTFGSTHSKGSPTQGFTKGGSSIDMKIFSLVGEVTKSKDETIASKNYTIQLLESMLQGRKTTSACAACGNGAGGE